MEIHLPKAARSWREFAIEIGTIICGILIALSLEQGIEWVHWRQEVAEAEVRLTSEVEANLRNAYARLVLKPCYDGRLVQLRDRLLEPGPWQGMPLAMTAPGPGVTISPFQAGGLLTSAMPPVYVTYFGLWPDDAWTASAAGGVTLHMSAERAADYTKLYRGFARLNDIQNQEQPLEARLSPLSLNRDVPEADRTRYLETIGELNYLNVKAGVMARQLISVADKAGLRIKRSAADRLIGTWRGDQRFRACLDTVSVPLAPD
jgi:hypothetical protein